MRLKRRGIALVVAGAACAVPVTTAGATEGSLYPLDPGEPLVTAPWTAIPAAQPGVWQISVPAGSVTTGTKFRVPFGCPADGSEIELVQYDRLRAAGPSAFAADIVADGARISRDPDIDWPEGDGTRRRVPVGSGACDVSFDLVQSPEWSGLQAHLVRRARSPRGRGTRRLPPWRSPAFPRRWASARRQ